MYLGTSCFLGYSPVHVCVCRLPNCMCVSTLLCALLEAVLSSVVDVCYRVYLSAHTHLGIQQGTSLSMCFHNGERSPRCLCICPSMWVCTEDVTYSAYVCALCANHLMHNIINVLTHTSVHGECAVYIARVLRVHTACWMSKV